MGPKEQSMDQHEPTEQVNAGGAFFSDDSLQGASSLSLLRYMGTQHTPNKVPGFCLELCWEKSNYFYGDY